MARRNLKRCGSPMRSRTRPVAERVGSSIRDRYCSVVVGGLPIGGRSKFALLTKVDAYVDELGEGRCLLRRRKVIRGEGEHPGVICKKMDKVVHQRFCEVKILSLEM